MQKPNMEFKMTISKNLDVRSHSGLIKFKKVKHLKNGKIEITGEVQEGVNLALLQIFKRRN